MPQLIEWPVHGMIGRKLFALVYQTGIANVFERNENDDKRVFQGDYRGAEMVCQEILLSGGSLEIYHCDETGDVNCAARWEPGIGELWAEHKNPPQAR